MEQQLLHVTGHNVLYIWILPKGMNIADIISTYEHASIGTQELVVNSLTTACATYFSSLCTVIMQTSNCVKSVQVQQLSWSRLLSELNCHMWSALFARATSKQDIQWSCTRYYLFYLSILSTFVLFVFSLFETPSMWESTSYCFYNPFHSMNQCSHYQRTAASI